MQIVTLRQQPPGPTTDSARALAPDLARGFMLLFIALAHAHFYLDRPPMLAGYPLDGSTTDKVVVWLSATFVDERALPMFGLLLGYGVAHIVGRQEGFTSKDACRLLSRRGLAFIVVGFLHCVLLAGNDILTAYGGVLVLVAFTGIVGWSDRRVVFLAVLLLIPVAAPTVSARMVSHDLPPAYLLPPDVATAVTERAHASIVLVVAGPVIIGTAFCAGLIAGRRRVLEQPERHVALLRTTAAVGIGAAVLGAQPIALVLAGVMTKPEWSTLRWFGPLDAITGIMGGFGYAALVGLFALWLEGRRGAVVDAIAATGQRSMTCYIAQSVVWAAVFTPFLLDMSRTFTAAAAALLGIATWLVTVGLADSMRRTGHTGPFEVLLRRVTYRQAGKKWWRFRADAPNDGLIVGHNEEDGAGIGPAE
jgi:uncharacterized protein